MNENEEAAHIARNWPTEDKRPEVDPKAQKEIDELWETIHGSQVKGMTEKKEESPSDST